MCRHSCASVERRCNAPQRKLGRPRQPLLILWPKLRRDLKDRAREIVPAEGSGAVQHFVRFVEEHAALRIGTVRAALKAVQKSFHYQHFAQHHHAVAGGAAEIGGEDSGLTS